MTDTAELRMLKDEFFREHSQSPLAPEQKPNFSGLNYFPENESLRFELPFEFYSNPERVTMHTNRGDARDYLKVGQIHFPVKGETIALQVYEDQENPGAYFVPFVDATAPAETYGAGR